MPAAAAAGRAPHRRAVPWTDVGLGDVRRAALVRLGDGPAASRDVVKRRANAIIPTHPPGRPLLAD